MSPTEKFVFRAASPIIWIIILIISVVMSIGIMIDDQLINYSMKFGSIAWENFWNFFKAPISVFVVGTSIYGIILAIQRTIILEKQFNITTEQHKFLAFNFYKKIYDDHCNEFITYLRGIRANRFLYGSRGIGPNEPFDDDFYRKLHLKFYGSGESKIEYKIQQDVIIDIQNIFDMSLSLYSKTESAQSEPIARTLTELGFGNKLESPHIIIGNKSMDQQLQDSLFLLCEILILSHQSHEIENFSRMKKIAN